MRVRAGAQDLHGNVPDSSPLVMLVIDGINDFTFEDGSQVLADARSVFKRIQRLKRRTRRAGIPTIYVNDNFGRWRSDFRALISHCLRSAARGRSVTRLLRPDRLDYFVLKPKHSAFYSTALELLLEHFRARTLILTGLLADSCVLATAQDAYMRGYQLLVPADCVAAREPEDRRRALTLMRRTLHTDTRISTTLKLNAVLRRAGRKGR
jgi:nicotinamidase-related amidase